MQLTVKKLLVSDVFDYFIFSLSLINLLNYFVSRLSDYYFLSASRDTRCTYFVLLSFDSKIIDCYLTLPCNISLNNNKNIDLKSARIFRFRLFQVLCFDNLNLIWSTYVRLLSQPITIIFFC